MGEYKMIKVLVISNDLRLHGISNVIMNYYNYINPQIVQMDIAVGEPADEKYQKEIKEKDGKLYILPSRKKESKDYYQKLNQIMKNGSYDIVHVHGNSATISAELFLGWINRIPVRIAHSHNSTCNNVKIHRLLSPIFNKLYTHGFTCSEIAGQWMFGDRKFEIIENGFNTQKFIYSTNKRNFYRNELHIGNQFVIGHVGFFNEQKNHKFLIKVFGKVLEKNPDSKLLLIGGGYKKREMENLVDGLNITENVIFYGESTDVEGIMSAMDCFVFPSLFEGLGIALLEAQINGLPCVVSDVVPQAACISNEFYSMSLNEDSLDKWSDVILNCCLSESQRGNFIENNKQRIRKYDIISLSEQLENLYMKCVEEI
ncbi:glycosyltransferase family 1 protein [Faecalicatena contorta]|nr:glycosyltransferase family 1 protein [Faecalicatena contorta]